MASALLARLGLLVAGSSFTCSSPTGDPRRSISGGLAVSSSSSSRIWWIAMRNAHSVRPRAAGKSSHFSSDGHRSFRNLVKGTRFWTNAILVGNIIAFAAQVASENRLLLMGAKVNSLIDQGEFWRLVTPSFLHANVVHLLVNSYSLNAIGPTVEAVGGPVRFLVVYAISGITGTSLSYALSDSPAVGASGAIFGLAGAFAVFLLRHKSMLRGGQQSLSQTSSVIVANLVVGLLTEGVDNWGHVGGLLGGAAIAWLVGPCLKQQSEAIIDDPPLARILEAVRKRHR